MFRSVDYVLEVEEAPVMTPFVPVPNYLVIFFRRVHIDDFVCTSSKVPNYLVPGPCQ